MLLQVVLVLFKRVLAGEGIGVVLCRKAHHAHVHTLLEYHVDGPEGGMDAGSVAVEHKSHVVSELAYEAYLLLGERGAAGGHHVADSELMQHHQVHVPLHHYALVQLGYLALGEPYAEEDVAFGVDGGIGGVDVFGGIVAAEGSAAEGNHASAHRVDGEHHPLAELVREGAVFPLDSQTGVQQIFVFVAGLTGGLQQGVFS